MIMYSIINSVKEFIKFVIYIQIFVIKILPGKFLKSSKKRSSENFE